MQNKVEDIRFKFKKIGSLPYLIYAFISIFLFLFFINSNSILNKDFGIESTELNKKMYVSNSEIYMVNRLYNPSTGYIQFNFKVKNKNLKQNNNIKVEIREKSNPTQIIPVNLVRITSEDYIFYTTLNNLKWSSILLTLVDNNIENTSKNKIKFYTNVKNIEINKDLNEKDISGYAKDILLQNIKLVQENLNDLHLKIKEKKNDIDTLNYNIKTLELEKEYQTEDEKIKSDSSISSAKNQIRTLENDISILNKDIKELEDKIKKLEERENKIN